MITRVIVFLSMFSLLNCTGIRVRTVSSPDFSPEQYNTFCWIDGCEERYNGPEYAISKEDMLTIRKQIGKTLEAKNYQNNPEAPDLLVGFHVIVNEQQRILSESPEMSDPYGYPASYWEDYNRYYQREKVFKFLKGSLVIDVIDTKSGNVVWQSSTLGYMNFNIEISKADLEKSIAKAMRKFPSHRKI